MNEEEIFALLDGREADKQAYTLKSKRSDAENGMLMIDSFPFYLWIYFSTCSILWKSNCWLWPFCLLQMFLFWRISLNRRNWGQMWLDSSVRFAWPSCLHWKELFRRTAENTRSAGVDFFLNRRIQFYPLNCGLIIPNIWHVAYLSSWFFLWTGTAFEGQSRCRIFLSWSVQLRSVWPTSKTERFNFSHQTRSIRHCTRGV